MSESSNHSDIFNKLDRIRGDAEIPTLNHSGAKVTSAPLSNSTFLSVEPRWTPFQEPGQDREPTGEHEGAGERCQCQPHPVPDGQEEARLRGSV